MEQKAWWLTDLHNWLTTIVGGAGIAGMAIGDDHPESKFLVSYASKRMDEYLSIYGPDGEYNESVHYANATLRPVSYFQAQRYWSRGTENRLARHPFPQTCLWQLYMTLPPGRVTAFGDSRPYSAPWTKHVAAVAAATRDPVLQWYYLRHAGKDGDPIALLWYDDTVESEPPEGRLPKGRAFPGHGGCIISRSDWHADSASCIVYGKSGREENHEHNDVGQLCIDGNGERLIIDIGSPKPSYPADFFDDARYKYYNASILGHNVLMIDGKEQRYPVRKRGVPIGNMAVERSGRILKAEFDEQLGAVWQIDLTAAYDGVDSVRRTVIHLLPGVVAVLDDATVPSEVEFSIRWHTIIDPVVENSGRFSLTTDKSRLEARVIALDATTEVLKRKHEYVKPYDSGRGGSPLEQHHEPYVEVLTNGVQARFLTLFVVGPTELDVSPWMGSDGTWSTHSGTKNFTVSLENELLSVVSLVDGRSLSTDI